MPKALAVLLNTAIYQMFMALLLDANFFKSSKKWFENCTERTTQKSSTFVGLFLCPGVADSNRGSIRRRLRAVLGDSGAEPILPPS